VSSGVGLMGGFVGGGRFLLCGAGDMTGWGVVWGSFCSVFCGWGLAFVGVLLGLVVVMGGRARVGWGVASRLGMDGLVGGLLWRVLWGFGVVVCAEGGGGCRDVLLRGLFAGWWCPLWGGGLGWFRVEDCPWVFRFHGVCDGGVGWVCWVGGLGFWFWVGCGAVGSFVRLVGDFGWVECLVCGIVGLIVRPAGWSGACLVFVCGFS